jgi:hypothetical protein
MPAMHQGITSWLHSPLWQQHATLVVRCSSTVPIVKCSRFSQQLSFLLRHVAGGSKLMMRPMQAPKAISRTHIISSAHHSRVCTPAARHLAIRIIELYNCVQGTIERQVCNTLYACAALYSANLCTALLQQARSPFRAIQS